MRVADLMTENPLTLGPHDTIGQADEIMMKGPVTLECDDILDIAADIMERGRIRHLPIVEKGRVVGVLSQRGYALEFLG